MSRLKRLLAREDGIAMFTVLAMITVLTVLSVTLIDQVTAESDRASNAVKADGVYQAAEAGVNAYIAKLLDDPQYYFDYVANGEATRTLCNTYSAGACTAWGGTTYAAGSTWTQGSHWGYKPSAGVPDAKNTWYAGIGDSGGNSTLLGSADSSNSTMKSGYAYDLMITPPSSSLGTKYVTIVSTGCRVVTGTPIPIPPGTNPCDSTTPKRTVEVRIQRSTPSDYQFMWPGDVSYGDDAKTYGRVYSGGSINHTGQLPNGGDWGDLLSEVSVTGNPYRPTGAKFYTPSTNPSIRTLPGLSKKVDFTQFQKSLAVVKSAAAYAGTSFDNSSVGAWRFAFSATGTFQVWKCALSGGYRDPESTAPSSCTTFGTYNVPWNGAIYTGQTAIVGWNSGANSVISGRVTIASAVDIVVAGNIHYQSEYGGANDDVLGLFANNDVWMAKWAPDTLFWRAATIAQNGTWSSAACSTYRGTGSSLIFVGSTEAKTAGCATDFDNRVYASDDGSYSSTYTALVSLFPPWSPVLNDAENTLIFHEVPVKSIPPVG